MRHYNVAILPFVLSGTWTSDCNDLTFWNQGTQNVKINGIMNIAPQQSITFPGYPGEILVQAFDITFDNDRLPGCYLVIVMKEYPKDNP
jgi:hypothetical protein